MNKNVKVSNPMKVITGPDTRWSYANVWEPKSINGGTPKYSVSLIIPKSDTKTVAKIKAAIEAAYKEGEAKLKGNGKSVPALSVIKTPLRDGDLERPDDAAYTSDKALLRIQQLETLLEQNAEQRETLHKLMAQGYIDQILFTQENNALLTQANDFRSDIEALNRSVTGDTSKVYETERLIHFCECGEMLLEYSEDLFELFVDHIEVYSRQSIGFVLHCGLTFKERI